MKQSRKLNWILIFFMLAGIFSGIQIAVPQTANAATAAILSESFDSGSNGQGVELISNPGGTWSQLNTNRKAQINSSNKNSGINGLKIYYKYSTTSNPQGPQNCGAIFTFGNGTVNYQNINVSYYRKSDTLEPDSCWRVQWSTDNSTWNDIEVITANLGSTFAQYSATLPAEADNSANFYLRFITDSTSTNTANTCNLYIDDVVVTGEIITLTTPSPVAADITASLNNDKIDLSWNGEVLATDSSTGYLVEVSRDGSAYTTVVEYTSATASNTAPPFIYSYAPAASGSYVFKVTGKAGGNLSETSATSAAVDYALPLAKPVLAAPSLSNGIVALSWTQVPEAQLYNINVMDDAGNLIPDKCINDIPAPSDSTSISGLIDGVIYTFSVTAKRNGDSIVSDVSAPLTYVAPEPPSWQSRIFGSGVSAAYDRITIDGSSVIIDTTGGAGTNGKISSNSDGIAYFYYPLAANSPFQLSARVTVNTFVAGNNQVAFGLMLRKTVGLNESTATQMCNFAAVGALNQRMQMFSRRNGESGLTNVDLISSIPVAGNTYDLRIIGTEDNRCIVSCGAQVYVINNAQDLVGENFYIGLFASRNTKVTFTDISLVTNATGIAVTAQPSKTGYFPGDSLDLTGLQVTATYEGGGTQVLNAADYTITGFNNSVVGTQAVTVNYAGRTAAFNVNINALVCTSMNMVYTPAKTTYYLGDEFDPLGMVVDGTFNSGAVRALTPDEYTVTGFDSSAPGKKAVTLTLNADAAITASFEITVRASILQSIEITRLPTKTIYYPGEMLNLSGMVVSAIYDDSRTMLQTGEYTVDSTGFDTASAGEKTLVISYKGMTANLLVTAKIRELTGIAVTTLPKTTFYTGEAFDSTGIVVSKIYDSGEIETLAASVYSIDSSSFDNNTPGTYNIAVVPADQALTAASYAITVRPQADYVWQTVVFGQSVSAANNTVTASAPGTTNGTITVTALTGGGKITGAHDGISFYYTEIDGARDNFVLSADIRVVEFAKPTPDNQEAFGLMVRDAIGSFAEDGTQPVFSSNIATVGGYRGLTNGFMRTGVTDPAGNEGTVMAATTWNTPRPGPANTVPNAPYRLTLAKTNTGFTVSLNGVPATSELFYAPDDFNCQDSKLYVGFFAARLATIEVSNVSFSVSDAATDAPGELPPPAAVTPAMNVLSLANVSKSDYALSLMSNVNGTVTIKQGEEIITSDAVIEANRAFTRNTVIAANSNTNFTITLIPDASQVLTSYSKVITNFTVTMKTYKTPDGNIYVSPDGTAAGAGTKEDPLNIDTAVNYVKEGQTIYMLGGTYNRTAALIIPIGNDGTAAGIKTIAAYNGEPVILDFGAISAGFQLGGNYWHIKGISVTRSNNNGILVGGSNNIIERCSVYANGNTGLQISRFLPTLSRPFWPANNLVLNCEAYDNRDASENNADGFAAKLTCGEGNVFRGCISHNNIDDGWDLYAKAETGPIGAVLIENCIAYNNGILTNGYLGTGDKNGFKLGGEGIAVPHVVRNSIAFGNGAAGFTSNSDPASQAYDCISYDNAGGNFVFTTFASLTPQFVLSGCVSYRSAPGAADSVAEYTLNETNYFYNGTASVNSTGLALSDANFASLAPVLPYQRDASGNIITGEFLRFISPGNATLKALTVDQGTLLPVFSPEVKQYVVTVKNNVKNATITPSTTSTLYSELKINGKSVVNGAPYKATLAKGNNFFVITVFAQDGVTKDTYLVNVYKEHDNRWMNSVKFSKELWDAVKEYWDLIKDR